MKKEKQVLLFLEDGVNEAIATLEEDRQLALRALVVKSHQALVSKASRKVLRRLETLLPAALILVSLLAVNAYLQLLPFLGGLVVAGAGGAGYAWYHSKRSLVVNVMRSRGESGILLPDGSLKFTMYVGDSTGQPLGGLAVWTGRKGFWDTLSRP